MIKVIYEKLPSNYFECACGNSPCVRTAVTLHRPRITFVKATKKNWRRWDDSFRTWVAGKLEWKGNIKAKEKICDECYYKAIGAICENGLDWWHDGYNGDDERHLSFADVPLEE